MSRHATRDSVRLGDSKVTPGSTAWHRLRQRGIGSSDLPKILGYSPNGDARTVYHEKRGELHDVGSEAADWGRAFEATVASEWARRHGRRTRRIGMLANTHARWMITSLNRRVDGCKEGPCALKVATRSAWTADPRSDEAPPDVHAQVQWQLAVTGYSHIHVAMLIGGQTLRTFRVVPNVDMIGHLIERAREVWDCVKAGTPPQTEPGPSLAVLLDRLHTHRDGERALNPKQALKWIHAYEEARIYYENAAASMEQARAAIVELLGDAEAGTVDGQLAVTYRLTERRRADLEVLAEDHPDAYAAAVRPTRHRTFLITRPFRYPSEATDV